MPETIEQNFARCQNRHDAMIPDGGGIKRPRRSIKFLVDNDPRFDTVGERLLIEANPDLLAVLGDHIRAYREWRESTNADHHEKRERFIASTNNLADRVERVEVQVEETLND